MLKSAIICPNEECRVPLQESLSELCHFAVIRTYSRYPAAIELRQFIRAQAPDLIFVGLENIGKAVQTATDIEADFPGLPVIAVHDHFDQDSLRAMMRVGVRDCIFPPFDWDHLKETITAVSRMLQKKPLVFDATDRLFCFLPAKPGVGCSTVALNTAFALAAGSSGDLLLSDCDFSSGILRFLLKLPTEYSMKDAAENSSSMDEQLWPKLVTRRDKVDVIHAGALDPGIQLESGQFRNLVEFWRRIYKTIVVDLSGSLERFSLDLMAESKKIFLVSSPELASLHLAREKARILQKAQLGDRLHLLLNRTVRHLPIPREEIPKLVGVPIHWSFVNDYKSAGQAIESGSTVSASSELGRQFADFSRDLNNQQGEVELQTKNRFIEFFTIPKLSRASGDS
jgi:pilus assembly protein CpaE